MKVAIDLKSLVIGAIVSGILIFALGAASHPEALRVDRFDIETVEGYVFVLDSITGQVWQMPVRAGNFTDSKEFMAPKL